MKRFAVVLSSCTLVAVLLPSASSALGSQTPALPSAGPVTVTPDTTAGDWGRYTHDDLASGFASNETVISSANASTMGQKWRFVTHDKIFSQATVANGMVFFNDNSAREYALDLSGNLIWTQAGLGETFGPPTGPGAYTQGPDSTAEFATISNGTLGGATHVLYVAGGVGDIFALNADTGAILWKTNITNPAQGGFTWTSPLVVNNTVYVGIASEADQPLNPGAFVKLDALTGGSVVTATIPPPPPAGIPPHTPNTYEPNSGPCVGGGIFGSPSFDPNFGAGGTIFVATGTLDPECAANNGAGALINPDKEESILAFDPATLTIRDFWHQPYDPTRPDLDFGSVPTLFDAPVPGTSGHMLGIVNKNGLFYALDRQNLAGGPKWTTRIEVGGGNPELGMGAIAPAAYDGTRLYEAGGNLTMTVNTVPTGCKTVVTAMDPTTGTPAWQHCYSGADDGEVIGPVTVANGVVLVGEGIYVKGLSAANGSELFSFSPSNGKVHTGPTVSNGVVYVGDSGFQMVALQPANLAPSADVAITKSAPAAAAPSGPIAYSLTATNNGPAQATGVAVTDRLPTGVSFVSATPGCTNSAGTVTCSAGTLAMGATATFTVNTTGPAAGTITNTATVSANEADPNLSNNSASAATTVSGSSADVAITKSAPATAAPSGPIAYSLNAANHGPAQATGVVVTDKLPPGVSFVSASAGCSNASGTVTCNVGTLASGASAALTINTTAPAAGTVTNTASIRANEADPNPSNNSASASTMVGQSADVAITKSGPASAAAGGALGYTVGVSNKGPAAATGVTVSDKLPAGESFTSASATQGSCAFGSGTLTCNVGSLVSGARATITVNTTAPATGGTVTNTATVSANEADPNPANNSASSQTQILPPNGSADVSIVKSASGTFDTGQTIKYSLTIHNAGPSTATGVVVRDALPSQVSLHSASDGIGTCNAAGSVVTCTLSTLAAGASAHVTIYVNLNTSGSVSNTATVSANQLDPVTGNNQSTVTIHVSEPGLLCSLLGLFC